MTTQQEEVHLIGWNRIKAEIVSCKDIQIMGKMNYSLEAIQKWAKQSKQSLETQNEIAEYRLRLNRKQGEWIEQNIPEEGAKGLIQNHLQATQNSRLTLADAGIDRNDSPKFRTLARIPEEKFQNYIRESKENLTEITTNDACRLVRDTIALKWTGDQESYTPLEYIEAARAVMGTIDLDPASCDYAQQTVKAKVYFTKDDNGLDRPWLGNIFLNPPYNQPDISLFVNRLLSELKDGQQAILLTNNNTDTSWFHQAAAKAKVICFTRGRINFHKGDGGLSSPTNGQVFFYFGANGARFKNHFSAFGLLMATL